MEGARVAASRLRRFKTIFRQAHYWRGSGAQLLRSRRTWQRVLSERLEASAAMGKGAAGDRDPETMEGGGWAVLEPLPALNTAEIMEHHNALVLVAVEDRDAMVNPLGHEWRLGARADVLSCCKTAGMRVPAGEATAENPRTLKEDLAAATARLLSGRYDHVCFNLRLLRHSDSRVRGIVEDAQAYRGAGALPACCAGVSLTKVMEESTSTFSRCRGQET